MTRDGTWAEQRITLHPGDTLITFSDGLFDLLGGTTAAFSDIAAIVSTSSLVGDIVGRVTALTARATLIDDVTTVVIRRQRAR